MKAKKGFSTCTCLCLIATGGCAAPVAAIMFKAMLWIGTILLTSAMAHSVEAAIDELLRVKAQGASISIRDVEVSESNPLRGIAKKPIIVNLDDAGASVELERASVERENLTSDVFVLDPAVREELRMAARKFN